MYIGSVRYDFFAGYVLGFVNASSAKDLDSFGLWLNIKLEANAIQVGWPSLLLRLLADLDWSNVDALSQSEHERIVAEAGPIIAEYLRHRTHVGDEHIRVEYEEHRERNAARFEAEARAAVAAAGFRSRLHLVEK